MARAEMMNERKAGLKAKLEAELAAAADDDELSALRDRFSAEERALEHQVDHEVHTFSATIDIAYNVSSAPLLPRPRTPLDSCSLLVAVPGQVRRGGRERYAVDRVCVTTRSEKNRFVFHDSSALQCTPVYSSALHTQRTS